MDENTLAITAADLNTSRERAAYRATVAYHPDISLIGASVYINCKRDQAFEICRNAPEFKCPGSDQQSLLADRYISRKPLRIFRHKDGLELEPHPEGTPVYVERAPLTERVTLSSAALKEGVLLNFSGRVLLILHQANQLVESVDALGMLGISDGVEAARKSIRRVADFNVPVLIRGETGTGKELIANAIHQLSSRSDRRMVAINVGAIPETLVIAELFGAKKGAYTGATRDKTGYFEQADGGTLFLDEIGDAPDEVQVALLRTLETHEIQPVGSMDPVKVDVRLIAATDADFAEKISDNKFRNPLLQRLSGYEIWLPPLRARRVDIALILSRFIAREMQATNTTDIVDPANPDRVAFWRKIFSSALEFSWPGNIRQLRNIAQQMVIHNRDSEHLSVPLNLQAILLNRQAQQARQQQPAGKAANFEFDDSEESSPAAPARRKPSEIKEEELLECLREQRYDLKNTAESLRISRAALYKMIEQNPRVRKAGDLEGEEIRACFQRCNGNLDEMVDALEVSRAALKRRIREMQLG